jgi:hypothetical protein
MTSEPGGLDPQDGVEAAMAGLAELRTRPTVEHVQTFERIHAALTEALSAIDEV